MTLEEFIGRMNQQQVRYLLIGGQALRLEGMPRFSMDWDLFVPPRDLDNFQKINDILGAELDLPLVPLGDRGENFVQTYQTSFGVLQFHLGVPGMPPFDEAYGSCVTHTLDPRTTVRCASGRHLLAAKLAANRPQDQLDIEFLREKERLGNLD